jgi:uncharacterized protein YjiS (DUF1127 family)
METEMIRTVTSPRTATLPRPAGLRAVLARWLETARGRRALLDLDERELRDIGLSRDQARIEAARPFWDLKAPY